MAVDAPRNATIHQPLALRRQPSKFIQQWGTVCDDGFGLVDATVACRQLGLGRALRYGSASKFLLDEDDDDETPASPSMIWIENLQCGGEESALIECAFRGWGNTDCSHSEDVFVQCAPPLKPPPPPPPDPKSTLEAQGLVGSDDFKMAVLAALLCLCILLLMALLYVALGRPSHGKDHASRPSREVHITLQAADLGSATDSSSEAQRKLASALSKALANADSGA